MALDSTIEEPYVDPLDADARTDPDWFERAAVMLRRAVGSMGAVAAMGQFFGYLRAPVPGTAAFLEMSAGLVYTFLLYGCIGLAASAVVRALGVWSASLAAESTRPPAPIVNASTAGGPGADVAEANGAARQLAEVRRLIRAEEWDAAEDALRAFQAEHPADPWSVTASSELERGRRAAAARLEAELQAARAVNDPGLVLEIHGRVGRLLDDERRANLDSELARWLLSAVHRRLRAGRIQAEVVALADRIAESFGHTADGASLRASLPTLRRSAGLCPRCAKPYNGLAPACPECFKASAAPTTSAVAEPEADPDPDSDEIESPRPRSRDHELFTESSGEPPE